LVNEMDQVDIVDLVDVVDMSMSGRSGDNKGVPATGIPHSKYYMLHSTFYILHSVPWPCQPLQ